MSRQFTLFVLIGGFAAAINLLARIVFSTVLSFEIAVVLAYLIGMTIAFLLNRNFVFDGKNSAATGQYIRFFIVNIVALAQIWLISIVLLRFIFPAIRFEFHSEIIAHAIALASPIVTSYFAHKYFSFRTT